MEYGHLRSGQSSFNSSPDLRHPQPRDYEVPTDVLLRNPEEPSTITRRISRQERLESESEDSTSEHNSDVNTAEEEYGSLSVHDEAIAPAPRCDRVSTSTATDGQQSDQTCLHQHTDECIAPKRKSSVDSAIDRDSLIDFEDVFDSGMESCIDAQDIPFPQSRIREAITGPIPAQRTVSCGVQDASSSSRYPRNKPPIHRTTSSPIDNGLQILLNKHSGVTV